MLAEKAADLIKTRSTVAPDGRGRSVTCRARGAFPESVPSVMTREPEAVIR
jgi:hypothetical protein